MDSRLNNNEPKRIKHPRHLEPIEPNLTSFHRKDKTSHKTKEDAKKSKRHSDGKGSHQKPNDNLNRNCCAKLVCNCEPGELDDWLNETEKRHENVSKYVDPYQWTEIKELPDIAGIKEETRDLNDGVNGEEDNGKISKGVDLMVIGVQVKAKENLDDLHELRMNGCIANLRVTRTGLAFEVFNDSVHSQYLEPSRRLSPLSPVKKQKSKKYVTAEQLNNKLRKAEQRRKACLAERVSHYKAMLGKYKERAKQMEKLDQERHQSKMKAIENRLTLANDRRESFNSRNYERCRTKNSRIAELLEKRRSAIDILQSTEAQLHNLAKRQDFNSRGESGYHSNMKSTSYNNLNPKTRHNQKPRYYLSSPKRKADDDFGLNFVTAPSPSLSIVSAAGDASESS